METVLCTHLLPNCGLSPWCRYFRGRSKLNVRRRWRLELRKQPIRRTVQCPPPLTSTSRGVILAPTLARPASVCISGRHLKDEQLLLHRSPSGAEENSGNCFFQVTPEAGWPPRPRDPAPRTRPGCPAAAREAPTQTPASPRAAPALPAFRFLPAPARLRLFWLSGGAKEKGAVSQMKAGSSRGHLGAGRAAAGAGRDAGAGSRP